jgi:hypothetical protein
MAEWGRNLVHTQLPMDGDSHLKFGTPAADALDMQPALIQNHSTPPLQAAMPSGTFVRRTAVTAVLVYTMLAIAMLAATPELRMVALFWMLWTLIVAAALATFIAGNRLQSRHNHQ